uniref:Uncharacterized protein n=1 Tax=Magallana gigas TaxID=29159 RepID=A0A8W8J3E4_MAGGI
MTEDGFRKKFRFSKPDVSETFMLFSTRLDSYLERWIQLSKTNKTFDDLKDLFLREQFLLCCSKELALFLKERIPMSIQDMTRYADQFAEARTVTSSSLTQKPLFDRRRQSDRQPPYKDSVQQNQSGNAVKCYECGRQGHKAFNCNFRKSPNNRPFNSSEKQETTPKHTYPSDFQRGSYNNGNHGYPGRGRGRQGAASVVEKHGNLPCVGCSGAVIRRELVNDDQLTGPSQRCKLADGRIIDSDVARIDVDTPYFTGSVDAWCFDLPSYDLILVTDKGNRYILTLVDYATRYPEAIPLPGIETERVAEALVDIFSRLAVPVEMLTDQGSQFTSDVMKEVSRLLSFKRITTTPYHPICSGLVEKFNGTLKQMLKRICAERPRDWDKYINPLLFAYREVPQESLGFSPFDLLGSWSDDSS